MSIKETITKHKEHLMSLKGRRKQIESDISRYADLKESASKDALLVQESQNLINNVVKLTQQRLKYRLTELGTLALKEVFPEPYELSVEFVQKRNKSECEIYLVKDDVKFDPMKSTGGGAVDVVAFALRIALWSLRKPKLRNLIILDEPLKFLSKDLQYKAGKILKEISERLNVQIIIVTHEADLIPDDGNIISIKQNHKGVSFLSKEMVNNEEER